MTHRLLTPSYWERSQWPLQGLFFLLPLLVVYEVGMLYYAGATGQARYIFARSLLQDFMETLGVTGYHLPALSVVAAMLLVHVIRQDRFHFELKLYWLMWTEAAALALPLFVFMLVLFRQPVAAMVLTAPMTDLGWQQMMLAAIGAGIYEELLFRLVGIGLVYWLIVRYAIDSPANARLSGGRSAGDRAGGQPVPADRDHPWLLVMLLTASAVLFARYHFSSENPFHWDKGLFYTGAGIYLGGIYVLRGFGIAAGTHAAYDVLVVILETLAGAQAAQAL